MKFNEMIKPPLERFPSLYLGLIRLKRRNHWSKDWVVTRQHDLVVEGFPRSANSFAFHAFAQANAKRLRIATHTHSSAQVVKAARWDIPSMVLMRPPVDAVTGILAFGRQLKQIDGLAWTAPSEPELRHAVAAWERFYRRLEPVRDKIFIASFRHVTSDFAKVSERFIGYAGRDWEAYDPGKIPEEELLGAAFHVGPNEEREKIKAVVKERVREGEKRGDFDSAKKLHDRIGAD